MILHQTANNTIKGREEREGKKCHSSKLKYTEYMYLMLGHYNYNTGLMVGLCPLLD